MSEFPVGETRWFLFARFCCKFAAHFLCLNITLPETNSKFTPENGWLEYDSFLLGWPIFRGELLVSGRVQKEISEPIHWGSALAHSQLLPLGTAATKEDLDGFRKWRISEVWGRPSRVFTKMFFGVCAT